ncbi:MAG TPA: cyanophycinase [Candidatus Dormibacteraeota bacterium]|nr:cyanophycinase [Candidatus Dormibacteraeota bacterium]
MDIIPKAGCLWLLLACGVLDSTRAQDAPLYGPASGTLMIVGGAAGPALLRRFVEMAGGANARLIVVPTAAGNSNASGRIKLYEENDVVARWRKLGVKDVHMLHTHDRKVANSEAFVQFLRQANAVWFDGGRQWNLVDSYAGTLTEREFHNVLARGGIIGGSSAGATIQGDYLVRGDVAGPQILMTADPKHQRGFAFLRRVAIDQHVDTRNRWDDLIPVIKRYPDLLGLGISEATALIVQRDIFEVVGKGKVAVHDSTRTYQPAEKGYLLLSEGDRYDMKARQALHQGVKSPVKD